MNFHAGGDFGGFTVTSSRIPEGYDVQHLSSVVISKGIAKDFKRFNTNEHVKNILKNLSFNKQIGSL